MPRLLVVAAAVTACGGVWGMAVAPDVALFSVFAVLSSAGAGLASPALVSIVARNVDPRRIDSAQSMVNAGTGPGLVAAGVLALALLPEWRVTWVLIGMIAAVCALAVLSVDRRGTGSAQGQHLRPSKAWVARHTGAIAAAILMGAGSSAVWTYGRSLLVETGNSSQRGTITAWIVLGLGSAALLLTAKPLARLTPVAAWILTCSVMTGAIVLLHRSAGHGRGTGRLLRLRLGIHRGHLVAHPADHRHRPGACGGGHRDVVHRADVRSGGRRHRAGRHHRQRALRHGVRHRRGAVGGFDCHRGIPAAPPGHSEI